MQNELLNNYLEEGKRFLGLRKSDTLSKEIILDSFKNNTLPTKSMEDWKYTSLSILKDINFKSNPPLMNIEEKIKERIKDSKSIHFIFVDGHFLKQFTHTKDKLNYSFEISPEPNPKDNFLSSFNQLFNNGTLFLTIDKNKIIEETIEILHFYTAEINNYMIHPKVHIKVLDHAQVNIFESFESTINNHENKFFVNSCLNIDIENNAHASHTILQGNCKNEFFFNDTYVSLKKDAHFFENSINLGNDCGRNQLSVNLLEEGSAAHLNGGILLTGKEHFDHLIKVNHKASNTESNQLYKFICDEESHGIFRGTVLVQKNVGKVNSTQLSKNLILSKKAQVHTHPILEIDADDVKCSHGATIGQLSPEEIFYLESRGITQNQAKKMICHGFLFEILEGIKNPSVKNLLIEKLLAKLSTIDSKHFAGEK